MKSSEKNFDKIFNLFIVLIASTILFRTVCTWIMILFVVYCAINYKTLTFTKTTSILILCIASPFLLEVLFFWNNSSLSAGLKSAEKTLSLLFLPIFIIGNRRKINLYRILYIYNYVTILLITYLFIRFIIISPKFFNVYLKGMDLWEVGYAFSNSFGVHAPALNMHLAFITCSSFWFVFDSLKNKKKLAVNIFLASLSFFFVLFVNTRMALFHVFLGVSVIFVYDLLPKYNIKKAALLIITSIILGGGIFYIYIQNNPYMKIKYTEVTIAHLDKIGNLDSLENPVAVLSSALVTRLSIWKSALELSSKHPFFGVGSSDGKQALFDYYKETNQRYLYSLKYPVHNQYLDFTIKFGILGFLATVLYMLTIGYLGFTSKDSIIIVFFLIFSINNLVDDFLIIFHGIVFSGFWCSLFVGYSESIND